MFRLFLSLFGFPWSDSQWNQQMRVKPLMHRADTNAIFDLIAALSLRLPAALAASALVYGGRAGDLHHAFVDVWVLKLNFILLFLEDFVFRGSEVN